MKAKEKVACEAVKQIDAVCGAANGAAQKTAPDHGLCLTGSPTQIAGNGRDALAGRSLQPIGNEVERLAPFGLDEPAACAPGAAKKDSVYTCSSEAHVPQNARATTPYFNDNYWKHPETQAIQIFAPDVEFGVPFAPTPFRVRFHIRAGSVDVTRETPIEFRYVKDIYLGDKRMELNVVPTFSVSVTPGLAVIPASGGATNWPPLIADTDAKADWC